MKWRTMALTGLLLSLAVAALPSIANAEAGIELRVPYQAVTTDNKINGGASGTSVLLFFGLDAGTEVGLLSEHINFVDRTVAGATVIGSYDVTAIRISKSIIDPMFIAIDLGSATSATTQATLADVVFGGKLLASKGKLNSFLNLELSYRVLNPGVSMVATGTATNYSGLFLSLGAGISF